MRGGSDDYSEFEEEKKKRCKVCEHFHEYNCFCGCPAIPVEDFNTSLGQKPEEDKFEPTQEEEAIVKEVQDWRKTRQKLEQEECPLCGEDCSMMVCAHQKPDQPKKLTISNHTHEYETDSSNLEPCKHCWISRSTIESRKPGQPEKWEDEYDLLVDGCEVVHIYETEQFMKVKSFISNLLAKQKEETIKKLKEMKIPDSDLTGDLLMHYEEGYADALDDCIEAIKQM